MNVNFKVLAILVLFVVGVNAIAMTQSPLKNIPQLGFYLALGCLCGIFLVAMGVFDRRERSNCQK
jgi:predicted tellurium resistance membrane protein TerC